jgi:hypothetical protein
LVAQVLPVLLAVEFVALQCVQVVPLFLLVRL